MAGKQKSEEASWLHLNTQAARHTKKITKEMQSRLTDMHASNIVVNLIRVRSLLWPSASLILQQSCSQHCWEAPGEGWLSSRGWQGDSVECGSSQPAPTLLSSRHQMQDGERDESRHIEDAGGPHSQPFQQAGVCQCGPADQGENGQEVWLLLECGLRRILFHEHHLSRHAVLVSWFDSKLTKRKCISLFQAQ